MTYTMIYTIHLHQNTFNLKLGPINVSSDSVNTAQINIYVSDYNFPSCFDSPISPKISFQQTIFSRATQIYQSHLK